jgi:hypothetical protein
LDVSKTKQGSAAITATIGSLTSTNYSFAFGAGTLTIDKAMLTVTPRAVVMSYGGTMPSLAYDLTGFVNGDSAVVVSGAPALTTTAFSTSPVGVYAIGGTVGTLASDMYSFKLVSGRLTVSKAVLTVTAGSATMAYGGSLPTLTYTVTGFVKGETMKVVSGTPSLTTQATASSPAGVYVVNVNATKLSSKNYSFTVVTGAITVSKATLTVTPVSTSTTYGSALPASSYQVAGFVNGDGAGLVSGAPVFKCSASSSSPVGQYPIVGAVGSLVATNYSFQVTNGTITVNKAVLTVTAGTGSMTYGRPLPALTYKVTGYVNGDRASRVSGTPVLSTNASSTSPAGVYAVIPDPGTLSADNYIFAMVQGAITVNQAVATITAGNHSMTYGGALPALTYTVSGLVNGDTTVSAASGTPSLTTTAVSTSPVGSYPISITHGNMTASNYMLNFVKGTLTVTQTSTSSGHKEIIVPRVPSIRVTPHRER